MTNIDLMNRIISLVPDAKVSIHDIDERMNADDGISQLLTINNLLVVWNTQNSQPCPTETEINNVEL